LNHMCYF